jgi:hypothetical protein
VTPKKLTSRVFLVVRRILTRIMLTVTLKEKMAFDSLRPKIMTIYRVLKLVTAESEGCVY